MNINILNISEVKKDYVEIKELYEESFPRTERFPFNYIIRKSNKKDIQFDVVYDENKMIGMSYIILEVNIAFILYFAVNNKHRGKGYGTEILKQVKEKYKNYTILLEIEEIKEDSSNFEQRIRRKAFYEKNGFFGTNKLIKEGPHIFEIMTTNANTSFDEKLFRRIYKKMFNGIGRLIVPIFIRMKN